MSDLWQGKRDQARANVRPLALRMRPRTLDELVGQQHILAPGKLLRRMLEADAITSLILHGPPGTGKTSLAELIAGHTKRHFERENASTVGVKRIREIIDEATNRLELTGTRTILFLDEIHRFSRSQQDVLLGDVERGLITLIGATTENPLFAVNSALVSRSTLFRLEPLTVEQVIRVLDMAIADKERGYGNVPLRVDVEAKTVWATKCDGDARRALTALEVAVLSSAKQERAHVRSDRGTDRDDGAHPVLVRGGGRRHEGRSADEEGRGAGAGEAAIVIDRATAEDSIQQKAAVYDGTGDEHYDVISAMIKSIRGSDPDAAVYWIARMLEGGEDPRFIARRLAILASEDIGNADPRAIMVAAACWELVERIGLPEARITLGQCAIYLACAPKSNASYLAIDEAIADVREGRTVPVPVYIKDGNVRKATEMSAGSGRSGGGGVVSGLGAPRAPGVPIPGTGAVPSAGAKSETYRYAHDEADGIGRQDYLGVEKEYYRPTDRGHEKAMTEYLKRAREARRESER